VSVSLFMVASCWGDLGLDRSENCCVRLGLREGEERGGRLCFAGLDCSLMEREGRKVCLDNCLKFVCEYLNYVIPSRRRTSVGG